MFGGSSYVRDTPHILIYKKKKCYGNCFFFFFLGYYVKNSNPNKILILERDKNKFQKFEIFLPNLSISSQNLEDCFNSDLDENWVCYS